MGRVKMMGVEQAERYLKRLQGGVQAIGGKRVLAGTDVEHAWGIEFGRKRNGGLARKAGGSFALSHAYREVKGRILPEMRAALLTDPGQLLSTLIALGMDVVTGTKQRLLERVYSRPIPRTRSGRPKWRRTRTLSRSYHVEVESSGLRSMYRAGGN